MIKRNQPPVSRLATSAPQRRVTGSQEQGPPDSGAGAFAASWKLFAQAVGTLPLAKMTAPTRLKGTRQSTVYAKPPVHEVICTVTFSAAADESQLRELPDRLRPTYPAVVQQNQFGMQVHVLPGAQPTVTRNERFDGWLFRDSAEQPSRVAVTAGAALAFHVVRPGKWPLGDYIGWSAIFAELSLLLEVLEPVYGGLTVRRAGLRYLNRLAIPSGTKFNKWLAVGVIAPSMLAEAVAINARATWSRIEGFEGLAATVGVHTIKIEEPTVSAGHVGFLLDIDVFNLAVAAAPRFAVLPDWFEAAHGAENSIFESCITDSLRATLT